MSLTPELIFTPEQLHFHQQQEVEQEQDAEELETEELDSEDPFITPSASIAIDEGTEDMEMEERPVDVRERGRNLRGCFKMDVVSVSATYSSVRNI